MWRGESAADEPPTNLNENWQRARQRLLEVAAEECAPFTEEAREHVRKLELEHGLDLPRIEPRVTVQVPEPGRVDLSVRIPVRADHRGRVEQRILERFLAEYATFRGSTESRKEEVVDAS